MNDPQSEPLREGRNEPAAPLRRSRKAAPRAPSEAVVAAEELTRAAVSTVLPAEVRRQGWEGTISRALIAHSPLAVFLSKAG
jgi:hypothetical protein